MKSPGHPIARWALAGLALGSFALAAACGGGTPVEAQPPSVETAATTAKPHAPARPAPDAQPTTSTKAAQSAAPSTAPPSPRPPSTEQATWDEPFAQPLWSVPLPDGFVAMPDRNDPRVDPSAGVECMGVTVRNVWDRKKPGSQPYVEVTDQKGERIYQARGRFYESAPPTRSRMSLMASACGDLDGNGIPDLLLTESSGGAHCCYTHYVVALTRPAKNLLMWEKGDGGAGMTPIKAKPGKHYQLISGVVTWPPFKKNDRLKTMGYAGAPTLPIIFDLERGTYRARTFRFASYLTKAHEQSLAACKASSDCTPGDLITWGTAIITGNWPAQREAIRDKSLLPELDRRADAFRLQLRRDFGH